jgi:heat shock protein HslJ
LFLLLLGASLLSLWLLVLLLLWLAMLSSLFLKPSLPGCNRLVGSYAVENDTVTLSQLAGAMVACPEPAMALESAFRAALGGPLRYSVAGEKLSLKPASGEPLVFVAQVQKLDGGWQVNGFNNGRDAVVGLKGDAPIMLTFKAGALTGDAGCNTFRGAYVVDGKGVKIGTLAASRKACAEELMKQVSRRRSPARRRLAGSRRRLGVPLSRTDRTWAVPVPGET